MSEEELKASTVEETKGRLKAKAKPEAVPISDPVPASEDSFVLLDEETKDESKAESESLATPKKALLPHQIMKKDGSWVCGGCNLANTGELCIACFQPPRVKAYELPSSHRVLRAHGKKLALDSAAPIPDSDELAEGTVLVKIEFVVISKEDVAYVASGASFVPGQTAVGVVVDSNVKGHLRVGQHVAVHSGVRLEDDSFVYRGTGKGTDLGAMSEFMVVKRTQIYILPEDLSLKSAAMLPLFQVSVHATDRLNLRSTRGNNSLLVFGSSPIALFIVALAKLKMASDSDYKVIVADVSTTGEEMAKKFGADAFINCSVESLKEGLAKVTEDGMVYKAVDTTGNSKLIAAGFPLLRAYGQFVMAAKTTGSMSLDLAAVFEKRLSLGVAQPFAGRRLQKNAANKMRRMLEARGIDLADAITEAVPMSKFATAFKLAAKGNVLVGVQK